MKKKTWIYIAITLIVLAGFFTVSVYAAPSAQSGNFKGGIKSRFSERKLERVSQALGLTDQQKTQIQEVVGKYRGQFRPLIHDMAKAQRELADAVMSDNYDEAAIRKASDRVSSSKAEIAVLAGRAFQDIASILTEEQLDIIKEFRQMRREHVDDILGFLDKLPAE